MSYQKTAQELVGFGGLLKSAMERDTFVETFEQQPGINADLAAATPNAAEIAASFATNKNWEVLGTNATSNLCEFAVGSGVTLTTATTAADQTHLQPHADTKQTKLLASKYDPQHEPAFAATIMTNSSIANTRYFMGFAITHTDPYAQATDADLLMIHYASDASAGAGNWHVHYNIGGTDVDVNLGSDYAVGTSQTYLMSMHVDSDRFGHVYIGGQHVLKTPALTAAAVWQPWIGVNTVDTTASVLTVRRIAVSKQFED